MHKIVRLKDYRRHKAAWRGFRKWKASLPPGKCLDENTTFPDLPDDLLLLLCEDNNESRLLIYDFIMGALDMGRGYAFESLPSSQLIPLLDICFMLTDLARFECMRRLGWIDKIPSGQEAIVALVFKAAESNGPKFIRIGSLTKAHPAYAQDIGNHGIDRQSLVRKYLKEALQLFRAHVLSKADHHPTRL